MLNKDKIFKLIAKSLKINIKSININSQKDKLKNWDSLGHLTFLSALDEETDGKTTEISDLTNASNLKEVFEILLKNNI